MRKLQRQIDKEEQRRAQSDSELDKLKGKLARMRASCSHAHIEMNEDGVVVCKDCGDEVAYSRPEPPAAPVPEVEPDGYGHYEYEDEQR